MSENIRAFIAFELNDPLRREITWIQNQLRPANAKVSWVKPQNAHLTVKFLGDLTPVKIDKITEILNKAGSNFGPAELRTAELGAFPNERHPKVLWLGLDGWTRNLQALVETIETDLLKLHFHKDRQQFIPHITIGRVRGPGKVKPLMEIFCTLKVRAELTLRLEHITLFASTLTLEGPIYEPLARVPLCG